MTTKRNPTLRTTTATNTQGVCVVEFVAGPRGYVWIGEGTRAIGFCGLAALKRFVASCEKAQRKGWRNA